MIKTAFANNKSCYKFFAVTVLLQLISIAAIYYLNQLYGDIYNGLQNYDSSLVWMGIGKFSAVAMFLVVNNGYLAKLINRLAFEVREGLTIFYSNKAPIDIENYSQRIQEDLRKYGELSTELFFAIFKAVIKLPLFIGVIFTLTNWYTALTIILVTVVGTIATMFLSKKYTQLMILQESLEANFRKNLLIDYFKIAIKPNFIKLNNEFKKLSFLTFGLGQAFVLLPFILLIPLYFSKVLTLGSFMQSVNALCKVIDSLSVLIDNRTTIANYDAVVKRIGELK